MPAVSKKQQRFFGMVRAAQKGEGAASPEVAKVASEIKKKDAKDYASTKHKGLPMKKEEKEELTFEGWKDKAGDAIKKVMKKKDAPKHDYGRDAGAEAKKRLRKKDHETVNFLDPDD